MESKPEKIIFPDSPEAATQVTITAWKSVYGNLYFNEREARSASATRSICKKCGGISWKNRILCDSCDKISEKEKYEAMPKAEWDGKAMLYSDAKDEYYESLEEAEDFLDEEESLEDLRLIICKPNYARPLESDHFVDDLPEDGETPEWLEEAIEAFNKAIKGHEPLSWSPGKFALKLDDKP